MPKSAVRSKTIEVEVRGVTYTFNHVEGTLLDVKPGSVVIVHLNKKDRAFTDVWSCESEIDYDVQGHMESILVSDRHKWFNKNYAISRLTACDENSFSFTGHDKKSVHMVRMGTKFYATKLN